MSVASMSLLRKNVMEFAWFWCETCGGPAIECPVCGNNCCNGSFGEQEDGTDCPYCVLAYQYQDLAYKTHTAPNSPDKCRGIWPKVDLEQVLREVSDDNRHS